MVLGEEELRSDGEIDGQCAYERLKLGENRFEEHLPRPHVLLIAREDKQLLC